jgi:hypothetical protein
MNKKKFHILILDKKVEIIKSLHQAKDQHLKKVFSMYNNAGNDVRDEQRATETN